MNKPYRESKYEQALGLISRRRQLQRELRSRLAQMTPAARLQASKPIKYTGSLATIR